MTSAIYKTITLIHLHNLSFQRCLLKKYKEIIITIIYFCLSVQLMNDSLKLIRDNRTS